MTDFTSPFLMILVAGVAANAVWRMAGVAVSKGLSDSSPIIVWSQAVSKALVAGLVARLVLFPPGALAGVNMPIRVGAFALGIAVFYVVRRNTTLGILAGTGALVGAHLLSA